MVEFLKVNMRDMLDIYRRRDGEYVKCELFVMHESGWRLYGINFIDGWAYFRRELSGQNISVGEAAAKDDSRRVEVNQCGQCSSWGV